MTTRKKTGDGAYGMINVNHFTFEKKPAAVRRSLTQQVWYTVYGTRESNRSQRPRSPIYDQDGDVVRYGDYKAWALGTSHQKPVVYRAIVSPKHHILSDHDFVEMVKTANEKQQLSPHFRLVIHTDTAHKHAHVLFGATEKMDEKQLEAWQVTLREEMEAKEMVRCAEQARPLPRANESAAGYARRAIVWKRAVALGIVEKEDVTADVPVDAVRERLDESELPPRRPNARRQRRRSRYRQREQEQDIDIDFD